MFITDKEKLKWYSPENRVWQGIPGIERTEAGRLFITFYSGFTSETFGNYVLVLKSDDDGESWEPVVAVDKPESVRYFDSVLWIDPLGRLWLTWAKAGSADGGVYGAICQDPDGKELSWGEPFFIGGEVMMNKPTVLSSGEWLFPIAIWHDLVRMYDFDCKDKRGSFVFRYIPPINLQYHFPIRVMCALLLQATHRMLY